MFRATYYVTLMVEAPVSGCTFEQAVDSAKRRSVTDLVRVRPGVDSIDHQIQVYSVSNMSVNGEM